jgi:DNA-binding transcriptional regulator YhcF (GntR family)
MLYGFLYGYVTPMEKKTMYTIDKSSSQPIWAQLAAIIAGKLNRRQIKVGEFVWSIRRVAEANKFSATAMSQAYKILVKKGVLESVPNRGYHVGPHAAIQAQKILEQHLNDLRIMTRQMNLKKKF